MVDSDDSADLIRRQMAESRSRLSEKLQTLEEQVSGTVQTTGTALSETAEAVKETVETITEAVQGAVKAFTDTFDLQQQMRHHPWLIIGGSVALGYVAYEVMSSSQELDSEEPNRTSQSVAKGESRVPITNGHHPHETKAKANPSMKAQSPSGEKVTSFFGSLASQVIRATAASLTESLRQAASQVGPQISEYVAGYQQRAKTPK